MNNDLINLNNKQYPMDWIHPVLGRINDLVTDKIENQNNFNTLTGSTANFTNLKFSNTFAAPHTAFTTTTITLNDNHYSVRCNPSGGTQTVLLPSASTCSNRIYVIKHFPASITNNVKLVPLGASDNIEGDVAFDISGTTTPKTIQSDGVANWFIIS